MKITIHEAVTLSSHDDVYYTNYKLRQWNRAVALLHFMQFAVMLIGAICIPKFRDFRLNLTYTYFAQAIAPARGLVNTVDNIGTIRIAPLVVLFFLLSALFQGATTIGRLNEIYNTDLSRSINRFRWYEYAISSSVMIVIIALFVGVSDLCSLFNIFCINACMNLFGLLMEEINSGRDQVTWKPFVFACIAALPPWVSIFTSLLVKATAPRFVYAIFVSYVIMFLTFPVNMTLQYMKVGPWNDYRFGEYVYITLSLVAKSLLGWLVFGGLNQPN
jgi:hypothetical protein